MAIKVSVKWATAVQYSVQVGQERRVVDVHPDGRFVYLHCCAVCNIPPELDNPAESPLNRNAIGGHLGVEDLLAGSQPPAETGLDLGTKWVGRVAIDTPPGAIHPIVCSDGTPKSGATEHEPIMPVTIGGAIEVAYHTVREHHRLGLNSMATFVATVCLVLVADWATCVPEFSIYEAYTGVIRP